MFGSATPVSEIQGTPDGYLNVVDGPGLTLTYCHGLQGNNRHGAMSEIIPIL